MSAVERFERSIQLDPQSGCWLWTRPLNADGYGRFSVGYRNMNSHKWSYEYHVAAVPEGLHLDHLCRVRHCVNPWHLEPVTSAINTKRGERAQRTHCPRDHAYTPENTSVRNGKRHCLACHRINQANYLLRKRAA